MYERGRRIFHVPSVPGSVQLHKFRMTFEGLSQTMKVNCNRIYGWLGPERARNVSRCLTRLPDTPGVTVGSYYDCGFNWPTDFFFYVGSVCKAGDDLETGLKTTSGFWTPNRHLMIWKNNYVRWYEQHVNEKCSFWYAETDSRKWILLMLCAPVASVLGYVAWQQIFLGLP